MRNNILLFFLSFFHLAPIATSNSLGAKKHAIMHVTPIKKIKNYLATSLSRKEFQKLDFNKAIIHRKDSAEFFCKIPYWEEGKLLLVRKKNNRFQHTKIKLDYSDTSINNYHKWPNKIQISGLPDILNGTLTVLNNGIIKLKDSYGKKGKPVDSIYSKVSLLQKGPVNSQERVVINVSLLFSTKESLLSEFNNKGVVIHDFIALDFIEMDVFDIEFANWEILPAINLTETLKKF